MVFRQGTPANTFSSSPTRTLSFILDPECVSLLDKSPHYTVLELINNLKLGNTPLEINLLLPAYLADTTTVTIANQMKSLIHQITEPPDTEVFKPDKMMTEDDLNRLPEDNNRSQQALKLLALAEAEQADGVITSAPTLIDTRYSVYQYHRIRIIPIEEFADVIDVFAHGHSIFRSISIPLSLTVDIYYQQFHWKNRRLTNWFRVIYDKTTNNELKSVLHNTILNRYPFLLYSRDMVRFYELQKDYYSRRGLMQRFSLMIGYYLSNFYLLLWGLLDQLTLIAKYARDLDVDERKCEIRSGEFWREFGPKEPKLKNFIETDPIKKWIDELADIRHAVAHRMTVMPTSMFVDTEESKKSDEQILKIIEEEIAAKYPAVPKELIKTVEESLGPTRVQHWRISKMKPVGEGVIFVRRKDGLYQRAAVMSVDYDIERANAVLDAFLVCLFR